MNIISKMYHSKFCLFFTGSLSIDKFWNALFLSWMSTIIKTVKYCSRETEPWAWFSYDRCLDAHRKCWIHVVHSCHYIEWLMDNYECFSFVLENVLRFRVCKSVCHIFNWINKQDAATSQVYYLSFKYSSTCFGHPHAHHQELQPLQ